ncbi:cell division protein FtsX [Sphingomonas oligoaromativorans]|uniref:cell division protein FtsX n=1 Tax=Sphingomonas oligoaromativorans TaxID=575322 RepID=UPI00141FF19B|nr:FtsX-like permease family protein [Sphingomonas oligoaromativorans]NIJ32958.1 cell division transport system permease protein [Sphingomonas oligoaromativorans]
MMMFGASKADRRLLPEGRLAGPMPWVIAIMMFLTALAAAGGLAMESAAARLGADLGRQVTVQIVLADPAKRDQEADAARQLLARQQGVTEVRRIGNDEMQALLRPWLGDAGLERDLPLPAMIDVSLSRAGRDRLGAITNALRTAAPHARLDDHASWLAPLVSLIRALGLLAGGIVALMVGATAAAVVLAARTALNTHRQTIDVMHLMGATDVQIARLFQRRIALDALFGGVLGLVGAVGVILLLGERMREIGSELVGSIALPWTAWIVLLALPLLAGVLALTVARITVQRALGRTL